MAIKTNQPLCVITLNVKGANYKPQVTDANGNIELPYLIPGEYQVIARKDGYHDRQLTVQLNPGQNSLIEMALEAKPGTLTLGVSGATGANISMSDGGKFIDQVFERRMPAGDHNVTVSKLGYQPVALTINIPPGKPVEKVIPLKPLPAEQALAQAEQFVESKDYDKAIEVCGVVLMTEPNNAQAHKLMGYSHYYGGRFHQSLPPLLKALDGNLQIEIPIKRYQKNPSGGDQLYAGQLMLRRGNFGFQSNEFSGPDVSVPANQIYELNIDPQKGGRIFALIGVVQGSSKKEKKEKFYYHPTAAVIDNARKNIVDCVNCQQELQVILKLIQRIKM